MATMGFNVDSYRAAHDSNTEWGMRRHFLLSHHEKFSLDRVLCLASCYISVECYGNRYPDQVMRQLKELTRGFPESQISKRKRNEVKFVKSSKKPNSEESIFDTPPTQEESVKPQEQTRHVKSKFDSSSLKKLNVQFVKASDPFSSAEPVQTNFPEQSTIFDAPEQPNFGSTQLPYGEVHQPFRATHNPTPKKSPSLMFVKSSDDYHSTDISHPGSSGETQVSAAQPDASKFQSAGSKKGLGFSGSKNSGQVLQQDLQELKAQSMSEDELSKFYALSRHVQDLSRKHRNAIETMHMAVDKVKMLLSPVFDAGPAGKFVCVLNIDFILVAKGFATNKKAAKHDAYDSALAVLCKPYLRINMDDPENRVLECSDEPFVVPGAVDEAMVEIGGSQQGGNGSRKRPAPGTAAALSQFLIIEPHQTTVGITPASILNQSAAINKYDFELDYSDLGHQTRTSAYLAGCLIADVVAGSKLEGKAQVCGVALEYLRTICWTIYIKKSEDTDEAGICRDEMLGNIQADLRNAKISDTNIGNKLLKKMGWLGGGLGKEGNEGIEEPITASQVINREGLGLQAEKGISRDFQPRMRAMIMDYAKSDKQEDLVFSTHFLKDERALIHKEAQKLNLKTHSHGSGETRYLVVSRKRTAGELFSHVMSSGGETSKYLLTPPSHDVDI